MLGNACSAQSQGASGCLEGFRAYLAPDRVFDAGRKGTLAELLELIQRAEDPGDRLFQQRNPRAATARGHVAEEVPPFVVGAGLQPAAESCQLVVLEAVRACEEGFCQRARASFACQMIALARVMCSNLEVSIGVEVPQALQGHHPLRHHAPKGERSRGGAAHQGRRST